MRYSIIALIVVGIFWIAGKEHFEEIDGSHPVDDVLERLGEPENPYKPKLNEPSISAAIGDRLFNLGISGERKGGRKLSKHFVCTSCHNTVAEDPDLAISDPEKRLNYAKEKGLPFLQGTTMFGAVNRKTFYNDDYFLKYGALVDPAKESLREAIQLCAVECAQGRKLKDWELESILLYLWTLQYKLEDLNISDSEMVQINTALKEESNEAEAVAMLKSKFAQRSPATFVKPPADRKAGYGLVGDPANGETIFDLSCMHCHEKGRYSYYALDKSTLTMKHLDKHFARYTNYSVYQVTRWGTFPLGGNRAYMPRYTSERMSNQQLEDLRAYIAQGK